MVLFERITESTLRKDRRKNEDQGFPPLGEEFTQNPNRGKYESRKPDIERIRRAGIKNPTTGWGQIFIK